MLNDIEAVLSEHADAGRDEPSLGWTIEVNPIAIHVRATTAETYGTEQQAFTAAVLLANRIAVDSLRVSQDATSEITAEGIEGQTWRGRVKVSLVRA